MSGAPFVSSSPNGRMVRSLRRWRREVFKVRRDFLFTFTMSPFPFRSQRTFFKKFQAQDFGKNLAKPLFANLRRFWVDKAGFGCIILSKAVKPRGLWKIRNQQVTGSNPVVGSTFKTFELCCLRMFPHREFYLCSCLNGRILSSGSV